MTTLALRARVSEHMLQEIMNGKRAISFLDMTRIAGLLGVGSNELMKRYEGERSSKRWRNPDVTLKELIDANQQVKR